MNSGGLVDWGSIVSVRSAIIVEGATKKVFIPTVRGFCKHNLATGHAHAGPGLGWPAR